MASQPTTPIAAEVEVEIQEVLTMEQELQGLTLAQLKETVKRTNEKFNLAPTDPGYLKVSGKKPDLIDSILEQEVLNSVHDIPVASAQGEVRKVKLSNVHNSPTNYRHDIDYEDAQLKHDIKVSGGLLKAPIVKVSGKNAAGEEQYETIGGNRSTTALRQILAEQGKSEDDYELYVIVRHYEGTAKQQSTQQILEMLNDNESAQKISPRDRLHAYKDLERNGLTRSSIAEKQGVTGAYISQTMKLEYLPERVLDLVHFDFNKEKIAAQGIEAMKRSGVPFKENADGKIEVLGISLSNATTMAGLFLRRPAQALPDFETAIQEWEQKVFDTQDFLMKDHIIEAAKTKSGGDFKTFLKNEAEKAGVIEKAEVKTTVKSLEATPTALKDVPSSNEEILEADIEFEVSEAASKPSDKKVKAPAQDVGMTAHEAATALLKGDIDFSMESTEKLAELLKMGDAQAFAAFKFLFAHNILTNC